MGGISLYLQGWNMSFNSDNVLMLVWMDGGDRSMFVCKRQKLTSKLNLYWLLCPPLPVTLRKLSERECGPLDEKDSSPLVKNASPLSVPEYIFFLKKPRYAFLEFYTSFEMKLKTSQRVF